MSDDDDGGDGGDDDGDGGDGSTYRKEQMCDRTFVTTPSTPYMLATATKHKPKIPPFDL